MDYFPAFLSLRDRQCLVVGGGPVAYRKILLLKSAGASLVIVAPDLCDDLLTLVAREDIRVLNRTFRASDVDGMWLVVTATGDAAVDRAAFRAASDAQIFCNSVDDLDHCSYITPAIVDRSPLLVAISSAGAAPVLARKIRARIEAWLPYKTGAIASVARKYREKVASVLGDVSIRRRFWESFFEVSLTKDALGTDIDSAHRRIDSLLQAYADDEAPERRGEAWLVGAGPGNPELLTLAALQALQTADVILYDRLVSKDILALARRDAEKIAVGKAPGRTQNPQSSTNDLLVKHVASGQRVCRLKGGDPFIFGRGGEEADALRQAGLPVRIIPGITAAAGCAASAAIPLTFRGLSQSVAFVTAHGRDSVDQLDWPSLARDKQTLVFYMGVRRFGTLMQNLVLHGRALDTPIAIIEKGTTPDERVIRGTLGQLSILANAHRVVSPSILIIGEVAALGQDASPIAPLSQSVYDAALLNTEKQARRAEL